MAYTYQGYTSYGVNINRQKYGALDISQVFTSRADLNYYISKGNYKAKPGVSDYWYKDEKTYIVPYPYAGQYLALVEGNTVTAYILTELAEPADKDGVKYYFECKEVGKKPVGDGKSISVAEDGTISIVGFTGAERGAQPRIGENGAIEWVLPDTTTVDGINTTVAGLQKDVTNLSKEIDRLGRDSYTEGGTTHEATGLYAEIDAVENRIGVVEGKIGDTTAGIVKDIVDLKNADTTIGGQITTLEGKVNALSSATHFRGVVSSLDEATDPVNGDIVVVIDATDTEKNGKEFIYTEEGWIKLGDTTAEGQRIGALETAVGAPAVKDGETVTKEATGLYEVIEDTAAALDTKIGTNTQNIDDIKTNIIGSTDSTGLRARIKAVETTVGSADSGLVKDVADLTAALGDSDTGLISIVEDLSDTVGSADSGLVKDVASLKTTVGSADSGLVKDVADLQKIGSEKNFIATVDNSELKVVTDTDKSIDRRLSITAVAQEKIYGLTADSLGNTTLNAILENKVEKVEGKDLSTNDYTTAEKDKLAAIAEGAQVNVIEHIKISGADAPISPIGTTVTIPKATTSALGLVKGGDEITVTTDGAIAVNQIAQSKITNLTTDLFGKVDKVEGKGLSTNDYTDDEKNKLAAIAAGAQVNTIEGISIAGSATITPDSTTKVVTIPKASASSLGVVKVSAAGTGTNTFGVHDADGLKVNLPTATVDTVGLVKSSADNNKVSVAADGTMEVNYINVSKLIQTEILILDGGTAYGVSEQA